MSTTEQAPAVAEEIKVRGPACCPSPPAPSQIAWPDPEHPAIQATPVFGAASTFGAGSGFAGFTGVASSSTPAAEGDDGEAEAGPEEECQAEFKPLVQLDEVETSTGEEDEAALLEL